MTDLIWLPTKEYTLLQDRNSYLFLDVGLFFNDNNYSLHELKYYCTSSTIRWEQNLTEVATSYLNM